VESDAGAASEPKLTQSQRAGKRRLNKQERLAEKAAAEAAAQKGAFLRYQLDAPTAACKTPTGKRMYEEKLRCCAGLLETLGRSCSGTQSL
jgi:hypothetical protein